MATAAEHDPPRFRQLLPQLAQQQNEAARQRERNIALLYVRALYLILCVPNRSYSLALNRNADPFDVDAQRQIEEAIQQEAVLEVSRAILSLQCRR